MGTNYYLEENTCSHCGRGDDPLHIGKSSCGWCFSLHVIQEEGIHNLDDWKRRWERGGTIKNEYGDTISQDDMLSTITKRKGKPFDEWDWSLQGPEEAFHNANHSIRGPNGLLRARIDGRHCVGHGWGAWDLIAGEFG